MSTRKSMQLLGAVLGLGCLVTAALAGDTGASQNGGHSDRRVKHFRAVVVTGVNSALGEPVFSWGEPFGAAFNFPTMGAFNKEGPNPLPLDASTPASAVLASYIDPVFLALFGKPPDYVLNPQWLNVPIRQTPINVDFSLAKKQPLPGVRDAQPLDLAQAEPANAITLGEWMRGRGNASISCAGDGAEVQLRMRGLIPNRMYSVWATMGVPPQPGQQTPNAFPIPIGGTPNIFVTDREGDASFERWIKFCPLDAHATDNPLLFIDVQLNANDQTYGAVISPGFIDGNWPGIITFSHVVFPINVQLLKDPGNP